MIIFPAIDIYEGKVVRLYKGDYNQMTIYNENPIAVRENMKESGATALHLVDLEGARNGTTPNYDIVCKIKEKSGMFCEIGGGIRDIEAVERYLDAGLDRVMLGTAAISHPEFLAEAAKKYGDKVAVGADIRNGKIAVSGWLETTDVTVDHFFQKMQDMGISTIACTDISRDGVLGGTNYTLYQSLSEKYQVNITASGGVSNLEDIRKLAQLNIYGVIIGKAYYEGTLNLKDAIKIARGENR